MRHVFGFTAALLGGASCFFMLVGTAKAQNLLTNPDLDTTAISTQAAATPASWDAAASRSITGTFNDGLSSEGFANVLQAGGMGVFFKPFQGDSHGNNVNGSVSASLTQTNPATPGLPYTLTGWAGAEANYVGLSDPTVKSQFSIEFLDSSNAVIGTSILDLAAAGLGQGSPTPPAGGFGYHQYSLSAIAPAGTASVRAGAEMIDAYNNPLGGGQAFVVDSFSLTVPEPASLSALSLLGAGLLWRRRR